MSWSSDAMNQQILLPSLSTTDAATSVASTFIVFAKIPMRLDDIVRLAFVKIVSMLDKTALTPEN